MNNCPEPCKQQAQKDFLEKDISDIIAKAIATALNDWEKQKEVKVDVKTDFDTTSSVITFEFNISLVDPTIQFSMTEK